jgi:hypothetical protein
MAELNWKTGLLIIIILLFFIDVIILAINLTKRSGPGGCSDEENTDGWIPGGILNWILREGCDPSTPGKCGDLGRWKKYAKTESGSLCASDVDKVWKDAIAQNIVKGYNGTQLLAYIIVPTVTVLGIIYGFLATNMNKAEWTFWIMIATIMATGITSITYDTDLSVLPTQGNPLEYVTSKLKLGTADELDFSFISRKDDGDECLIKGTVYGASAETISTEPITYSGECQQSDVPF